MAAVCWPWWGLLDPIPWVACAFSGIILAAVLVAALVLRAKAITPAACFSTYTLGIEQAGADAGDTAKACEGSERLFGQQVLGQDGKTVGHRRSR